MRTDKQTFFGLTFTKDFPLDEKSRHQLANILLLNPRISVQKAKDILNNKVLWQKVGLLTDKLHYQISDISLLDSETETNEKGSEEQFISYLLELLYELFQLAHPKEDFDFVIFKKKFLAWVIEFSFPLPNELIIIASTLKTSKNKIFEIMYMMLFLGEMPSHKIIEYLKKYYQNLAPFQLEELLDLYSFKSKGKLMENLQLGRFGNNN